MNEAYPFSTSNNVDHPMSLYAASKKSNELMAHTYSHLYGISTTGLRFFTVYGPWADATEVKHEYGCDILPKDSLPQFADNGAVILTVAHDKFMDLQIRQSEEQVIYDVKGISPESDARSH